MKLNKLMIWVVPQRPFCPRPLWYLASSISVCVTLLHSDSPTPPPQERRPMPREAPGGHSTVEDEEAERLDLVLGTVLWYVTAVADHPAVGEKTDRDRRTCTMLWAPTLGVWEVGLGHGSPRPSLQTSHSWPLFSKGERGGGREAQAAAVWHQHPQSFFRRLYISLLLFSPAQVRLLVRNFFRSSLKSSWCMGR